jgi:beta-glucanase (GH16 family)
VGGGGGPWATLAFDDEFSGNALDGSLWSSCYPWGDCTNRGNASEVEWYTPANVTEANGELDLTAQRQPVATPYGTYGYTSGMMQTDGHFSFTYGYTEARIWLPAGDGLWPAFWLMPVNQRSLPEVDILEADGALPNQISMTYHDPAGPISGTDFIGPNFTGGWHTFGIDWEPGSLTWYVDGVAQKSLPGYFPPEPMYPILNLAVSSGASWMSSVDASTPLPATMRVDYVRTWFRYPPFTGSPALLASGQTLSSGTALDASNGHFELVAQTDGNLVIYNQTASIWATGTYGAGAGELAMQSDGNLVLYGPRGAVWSSGTYGSGATELAMQTDGNLVLYGPEGPVWSIMGGFNNVMTTGRSLGRSGYLPSPDDAYRLVLQGDGNVVVWHGGTPVWSTGTSGQGGDQLVLQSDGNLVLYGPRGAVWSSGTWGSGAGELAMQSDGNLVLYGPHGAVWSSRFG